jgi:hypothetical protein
MWARDDPAMMAREVSDEDLAALNELVQSGLAEVVTLEDGQPHYRLASRFTIAAAQAKGPEFPQNLDADQVLRFLSGGSSV